MPPPPLGFRVRPPMSTDKKSDILSNSMQRAHKGPLAAVHDQRALICASELCDRLEKGSPPLPLPAVPTTLPPLPLFATRAAEPRRLSAQTP